ncbi:hypothetical protein ACHHYP_16846 [Achlya hypogyna]|uniref:Secreted protein n=1 Tax=Achlya hypogyna TaxID=1202772 RepID=A0A1V9Y5L8_ACHHY|nr:hypothetical protein ACHHYP_16846 [Achlya hypogyna]
MKLAVVFAGLFGVVPRLQAQCNLGYYACPTTLNVLCCCKSSDGYCQILDTGACVCGDETSANFTRFLIPLGVVIGLFGVHALWRAIVHRLPSYHCRHEKGPVPTSSVVPTFVPIIDEPIALPALLKTLRMHQVDTAVLSTDGIEVVLPPNQATALLSSDFPTKDLTPEASCTAESTSRRCSIGETSQAPLTTEDGVGTITSVTL